jgi:hypothetical protein
MTAMLLALSHTAVTARPCFLCSGERTPDCLIGLLDYSQ